MNAAGSVPGHPTSGCATSWGRSEATWGLE